MNRAPAHIQVHLVHVDKIFELFGEFLGLENDVSRHALNVADKRAFLRWGKSQVSSRIRTIVGKQSSKTLIQFGTSFGLQGFYRHAWREFHHLESLRRHVHHGQVGDDAVHQAHTGQGQRAIFKNFQIVLAVFLFGDVLHQDDHALDACPQIHRAAHALDHFPGDHPVGQIALFH